MTGYDTCIAKLKEATDYLYEAKSNKKDDISGDFSSDSDSYPTVKSVKSALSSKADTSSLSSYVQKSQTSGLLKNDGTIDTTSYVSDVSGKADKTSGVSQITDPNAHSNIGTSAGATQSQINSAIDTLIGDAITYINGTGS